MIVRRSVVSAVLAWLAVVAVGSTVVWAVISRAGDGIAPTADPGVVATSTTPPPSPSHSPSPSRRPSPSASTQAPAPTPQRRTWQGPGGFLTVECRGGDISLVARSADAGFTVDELSVGSEEVKVKFEGQGEEGRETEVTARCVDGLPDFEVSASDD